MIVTSSAYEGVDVELHTNVTGVMEEEKKSEIFTLFEPTYNNSLADQLIHGGHVGVLYQGFPQDKDPNWVLNDIQLN